MQQVWGVRAGGGSDRQQQVVVHKSGIRYATGRHVAVFVIGKPDTTGRPKGGSRR